MLDKRKNIIVIVGAYHPFPSAVGVCAEKIVDQLKVEHDVTIVSLKDRDEQLDKETYNGYEISRVTTKYNRKQFQIKNSEEISEFGKKIKGIALKSTRLLKLLLSKVTIDNDIVSAYYSELKESGDNKKVDVIISTCFPFESVVAALKFKNSIDSSVQVIPYLFDNFAHSASLHRFNWNRRIKLKENMKLEVEMLQSSTSIFSMHPLKTYFESHFPSTYLKKISYVEHPLLVSSTLKDITLNVSDKINLIYAGGLFKNVREPKYMLRILDGIQSKLDIECNVYAFGNASKEVERHSRTEQYLRYHGHVSRSEIVKSYSSCDVLINLGEIEGKQISSKIFEYMSLGKPLIHIAFTKNCVVSGVLAKYPLAIIICVEDDFDNNLSAVIDFIELNAKERLTFDAVKELYKDATPEFTANRMSKVIYKAR